MGTLAIGQHRVYLSLFQKQIPRSQHGNETSFIGWDTHVHTTCKLGRDLFEACK